ncbi:site-specific tyrosine recombinase XerC [Serratia fonticola]|uniref:tyrosine-type recombinase/integrase n=1 Tax=Serratia fonticola TaxID=47917 RepID=UPI00218436BA|nr:tyrosine-type recombinase/integrase [Serratia fonticola]CAI2116708.1 site-specific tyrosine recombinase XerC [Serratia fonticola]
MVIRKSIQLEIGALGSFNGESAAPSGTYLRVIKYQLPDVVLKFPVLYSTSIMSECLDANLFLQQKYTGRVNCKNIQGCNRGSDYGTVKVVTLEKMANSLKTYLSFCKSMKLNIYDGFLNTFSADQTQWLPPYRFKNFIIERVKSREIQFSTGNLLLLHVKQFYEWMYKTGRIEKIPFNYTYVSVSRRKDKEEDGLDLLFAPDAVISSYKKSFQVLTTDLRIPKKHKTSKVKRENEPWSHREMEAFFTTQYMQSETRRLWADLGFQSGLRAVEVTRIPDEHIVDPELFDIAVFDVDIIGKNDKRRTVLIPRKLMLRLFAYKNSANRLTNISRYTPYIEALPAHSDKLAYEKAHGKPLFVNHHGSRISERSVVNLVSKSRTELRKQGSTILEEPHFHGARATYATRTIQAMLLMEMPMGFIKWKMMCLMGHNAWDTTLQHYINLARGVTYDEKMDLWVSEIYRDIEERLTKEKQELSRGIMTSTGISGDGRGNSDGQE